MYIFYYQVVMYIFQHRIYEKISDKLIKHTS